MVFCWSALIPAGAFNQNGTLFSARFSTRFLRDLSAIVCTERYAVRPAATQVSVFTEQPTTGDSRQHAENARARIW
jgi:hypothetical protein